MATFYRCDRCKEETSNSDDLRSLVIDGKPVTQFTQGIYFPIGKELCYKCVKLIFDALKTPDKLA